MNRAQILIFNFLDVFYPIFKRFMDKQTYHYLACGGGNTLFGLVLFFVCEHYVFHQVNVEFGFFTIKPHIASFIVSFSITFPIGFLLSKYVVWNDSNLPGKKQFTRHLFFVIFSVFLNYILLKLFVDYLHWWPMPSQVITTSIIVIFSYIAQKYFTFK
jgi:putative flippase GtrA